MELGGETLDLGKVTIPVYELAASEDHIAPARSVFTGAKCFGGPVRYVMAGSGHIAGVVNPPAKPKYQFWSGGPPKDDFEILGRGGERDAWFLVARLGPMGHGPGAGESRRPQAGRRQAESHRRCSGRLCAGESVV